MTVQKKKTTTQIDVTSEEIHAAFMQIRIDAGPEILLWAADKVREVAAVVIADWALGTVSDRSLRIITLPSTVNALLDIANNLHAVANLPDEEAK